MAYQFATLASGAIGVQNLILDPKAKSTTVQLNLTASSTGVVTLYMSVWDPTQVAPTGWPTSGVWTLLSSGLSMLTSNVGGPGNGGLTYTVLSPVGAIQLNSSTNNGTIYVTALQSVTA